MRIAPGCSYAVLPASGAGITEAGRSFDGDRDACRGGSGEWQVLIRSRLIEQLHLAHHGATAIAYEGITGAVADPQRASVLKMSWVFRDIPHPGRNLRCAARPVVATPCQLMAARTGSNCSTSARRVGRALGHHRGGR